MHRTASTSVLTALLLVGVAALAQAETGHTTTAAATTPAATASHTQTASHATKHKEDLNAASREELMKLPGVSEATADKIIAARPFKSKEDLVSKKILTKKEYSALSSHVMVKSASTTASKTNK